MKIIQWMLMGLFMSLTMTAQASFIEDMNISDLNDKKIAYLNGSFDPYHKGHEAIAQAVSQHVDFVIVYANPGKSSRKPYRTDHKIRQKQLDALYHEHPTILISHLDGYQLQQLLLKTKNTEFIGVLGSDVAQEFETSPEWDQYYMYGTPLKPDEGYSSKAAPMIVKANRFFGFNRKGSPLPKKLASKRDIIPLNVDIPNISSTEIRQKIQEGESLAHLLHPKIINLLSNK